MMNENSGRTAERDSAGRREPSDDVGPGTGRRRGNAVAVVAAGFGALAVSGAVLVGPGLLSGDGVRLAFADQPVVASSSAPTPPPAEEPGRDWAELLPAGLAAGPPTGWTPVEAEPPTHSAEELAARAAELAPHIEERVRELAPEATEVTIGELGGEGPGFHDGQDYVMGEVSYEDDHGPGQVAFQYNFPGVWDDATPDLNCSAAQACGHELLDDGSAVMYAVSSWGPEETPAMLYAVDHLRVDGSVLSVWGYNYDFPTGQVHRPLPVPGFDGLADLATDGDIDLRTGG
ncbi:hypothetical protein [Actinoalloteichus spitiensis]|uniref:hypothetical protein n=1 Tax=Actinoalloteichus spitiensis TaxID=252394 RepID=UPI000381056A|nr:hypothetical protein [Actinoalloteichus spitiensis]